MSLCGRHSQKAESRRLACVRIAYTEYARRRMNQRFLNLNSANETREMIYCYSTN